MMSKFKIYSDVKTKETYIEVWGASTKHPDLYKKVEHDNPYFDNPAVDTIQTLMLMGSETLFPLHLLDYVKYVSYWCDLLGLEGLMN